MYFQFLGTGNARQVPCYGCNCIACERARVMTTYRRGPCSAKIQIEEQIILLDAGLSDLTERFPSGTINTILLTHYHMDHVQGLFHLRWGKGQAIPVIGPDDPVGCDDLYKHPGILHFLPAPSLFKSFYLQGIEVIPVPLNHSKPTVGYIFNFGKTRLAYLTDTLGLPEKTHAFLKVHRPNFLVLDCSYPPKENPNNHNSLTEALSIIEDIKPDTAYLTHIGHDLDAYLLQGKAQLPDNVYLASDGKKIALSDNSNYALSNQYAS